MSDTNTDTEIDARFMTSSANVISEEIAGQSVVIDFDSGCYFSMNESASLFWRYLQQGYKYSEILGKVNIAAGLAPTQVHESAKRLIAQLIESQLIKPRADADMPAPIALSDLGEITAVPTLDKFDDLQEMLLLDPIHEVDAQGWPHAK